MKKKLTSFLHFEITLITILTLSITILFIGIKINSDYVLYQSKVEDIQEQLDSHYYAGWDITTLRDTFQSEYPDGSLTRYMMDIFEKKSLSEYQDEIWYQIDKQTAEIEDQKRQVCRTSAVLFIPEIAQDTKRLDTFLSITNEGIATENLLLVEWSLEKIKTEHDYLRTTQDLDIQDILKKKVHTIDSIVFISWYYGLDQNNLNKEAAEISQNGDEPLAKFMQLDEIIVASSKTLDRQVTARGGKATDGKRIFISIGKQRLYMIENYNIVYEMPASTGIHGHGTAAGEFQVYEKVDMAWGYYEIWMPYWLTIYYSSGLANGIHGIPISPISGRWSHWDSVVGVYPITYGCVMPKDPDAKKVYEWADIGTPVSISY